MLRTRGVYSVLVVKALAAAEPGGAKGEGGSLASSLSVQTIKVSLEWYMSGASGI